MVCPRSFARIIGIGLTIAGLFISTEAYSQNSSPLPCPRSISEWLEWRNRSLQAILPAEMATNHLGIHDSLRELRLYRECERQPDAPSFFHDPGFQACLSPIADRFNALQRLFNPARGHSMGLSLSDDEYFRETRIDFPEQMQVPAALSRDQRLLEILGNPLSTSTQIQREIHRIGRNFPGLQALEYTAASVPTMDRPVTRGRILLFIPGRNFDQWIQVGRNQPNREGRIITENPQFRGQQLSIVAVQKRGRNGRRLANPIVRFNDLWQNYNANTHSTTIERRPFFQACYQCHVGGVMPIYPSSETTPIAYQPRSSPQDLIRRLNGQIEAYGSVRVDGLDSAALGPPIGERENPRRTDAFFQRCSQGVSLRPGSLAKLRSAMQCTRCHDDHALPALRYPMLQHEATQHAIVSGNMPPFPPLNSDERSALLRCLTEEYYGTEQEDARGQLSFTAGTWHQSLNAPACAELGAQPAASSLPSEPATTDTGGERDVLPGR